MGIAAQQALIDLAPAPPDTGGCVLRHRGAAQRKNSMTTSLKLGGVERELLERMAVEQDVCRGESGGARCAPTPAKSA